MLVFLQVVLGCSPDFADSGPTYPGWALEAQSTRLSIASGKHTLHIRGETINPCQGCSIEHDAQLTVRLEVEGMEVAGGERQGLDVRLSVGEESAERRVTRVGEVLLRVPLFKGCDQNCRADATLEIDPATEVSGSWSAEATWLTVHDSETWKPTARLTLE